MNENTTPMTAAPAASIPEDVLIILPASDAVLFPGVVLPITVHGKRALAAAQEAVRTQRKVGLLLQSTEGWTPPDMSDISGPRAAVAQPHCHQHAVLGWDADAALLRDAGATVNAVGGCCGLAGNFGVERGHYDVSVAVAQTALLPAVRALDPGAVVLADGFSCRTQLDQLAGVPSLHLAQLLADHLENRPALQEPR